jgi:hypothetical protein
MNKMPTVIVFYHILMNLHLGLSVFSFLISELYIYISLRLHISVLNIDHVLIR